MYKPFKPVTRAKNVSLNDPSENSVLEYKVEQRKNGKIPSNYKLA